MKENNLQPRLLYLPRISFRYEGELKRFTDKQKLREFSTTKPALQQMLKDLLQTGNTERLYECEPKTTNQMAMGLFLSIITLNVNGLNAPTKRQRLAEWIQKQDPYICCLQETHLKARDTYRLKVKGWKKIFHANGDQKKAGVAILIPDKIRLSNKGCEKRQRRTLHDDQRINPRRRYNKYTCTQHRSTVMKGKC